MNIKRKIQWAAAAVLVNAMAALVSLSSSNAEAGTCTQPGPKVLCEPGHGGYCPTQPTLACSAYAPPAGCTLVNASCTTSFCSVGLPNRRIICTYQ